MSYTISGIQQLGIGVRDVADAWRWYRTAFGMDVPVFQDEAEAPLMTRYTGNAVHSRNAVLALNLSGGAGFEIWQFTSRTPEPPSRAPRIGDVGILAGVMKSRDVDAAFRSLSDLGADVVGEPTAGPDGARRFFVRDPYGNLFQIAPASEWFGRPAVVGGVAGAIVGCSNVDRAMPLYRDVLGYDTVLDDSSGVFPDLGRLEGGDGEYRRVLLTHGRPRVGPFSKLMGTSTLELVQPLGKAGRAVFDGRFWGDLGFIHLCFDVRGMNELAAASAHAGHAFTVDSGQSFGMGSAAGRFSYVEDPDRTLIEFVETHRVPIAKRLGLSLDLTRRPADKSLPAWMIRMLGLGRVR